MKPRSIAAIPVVVFLFACGGATFGTNEAGGDGWLDHEPPGTEDVDLQGDGFCAWTGRPYVGVTQERAYALLSESSAGDCHELSGQEIPDRKTVWGLLPGDTVPELMLDVTGLEDVRLLDTDAGLLLMGQVGDEQESLYVLDHDTLAVTAQREVGAYYWGTRTAPSRRFVAVADNAQPMSPLTLIDPTTLDTAPILDLDGWGEAMWAEQRDLLAAVAWAQDDFSEARLVVWDFSVDGLTPREAPTRGGRTADMPDPILDVVVDSAWPELGMGFTWIAWHPEDETVVFPVTDDDGDQALLLLDVASGEVRRVEDAAGPASFTPDGSTLVAWDPERDTELVLIDPVTLESERLPLPLEGTPQFFVSHDGNQVVVADAFGEDQLQIVDLDTGASTTLDTRLALADITVREGHDEVWAVADGLWRIDLREAVTEQVDLGWTPDNVVWMPESDLLYLDDAGRPRMVFWDPTLRTTLTTVDLPGPEGRAVARMDLSRPLPTRPRWGWAW